MVKIQLWHEWTETAPPVIALEISPMRFATTPGKS